MIKLFIAGDYVNSTGNERFLCEELSKIVKESDLSICNLEAPLISEGVLIDKAGPVLSQHNHAISYLANAGFNAVTLANNHIMDYGIDGLKKTIESLNYNNINYFGAGIHHLDAYEPYIFEQDNLKIALVSCAENGFGCSDSIEEGGYAWLFSAALDELIRKLNIKCDFVIVCPHAGLEDVPIPLPEFRTRYRELCDLGADFIIGHHPHVPQGYEEYGSSMIFYSLGNFYFDTNAFAHNDNESFSVSLEIQDSDSYSFELVFHHKLNNQVSLAIESNLNFSISSLNELLESTYNDYVNNIVINCYKNYYHDYYLYALNSMPKNISIKEKFKWLGKKYLFSKIFLKKRRLMLIHNLIIETHRFVTIRALKLLNKQK